MKRKKRILKFQRLWGIFSSHLRAPFTWTAGCHRRSGRCTIPQDAAADLHGWLPPSKRSRITIQSNLKKKTSRLSTLFFHFDYRKFSANVPAPLYELLEMELRNCQIQVSKSVHGRALTHWKTRGKVLRDAIHSRFWGNTHPGPCYPSKLPFAAWFTGSLLPGSEKEVANPSVGSGRLSERTFPLCGVSFSRTLSLRVRTWCWLTITINTLLLIQLLGLFTAQLREPTMARSESPWKWSGRGSSKALAEATGLPSLPQQEEPCEASKLINLRFPTAENPLNLKKKKGKQN